MYCFFVVVNIGLFILNVWLLILLVWWKLNFLLWFIWFILLCFIWFIIWLWFILVIVWLLYFFISICIFIILSIGFIESCSLCIVSFFSEGNVGRLFNVFGKVLEVLIVIGWICIIGWGLLNGVIVIFIWLIGSVIRLKGLLLLIFISILKCLFISIGSLFIFTGLGSRLLLLVIIYSGWLLLVVKLSEWVL